MKIGVLLSPGCENGRRTLALVADVARRLAPEAEVETIVVATSEDAERLSFPGSPTVLVDDADIDPQPPSRVGLG